MKNKRRRRLSFFICCFKSCFHELSTVKFSYFVRNNFSCIQIDNGADIVLFIVALKICNIAYPYLIGRSCIKFLVEIIFVSSSIVVIIFFLRLVECLQVPYRSLIVEPYLLMILYYDDVEPQ